MRERKQRFCREYVIDNNATQAAIRAGYSKRSAEMQGSRLLTNPDVIEYVAKLRAEMCKRNEVTEDFVIQTLLTVIDKGLGTVDTNTLVKEGFGNGISQVDSRKLKKDDLQAVKGAAELLGRYKGMFTDNTKVEHSGQILKRIVNVNPTKAKK